MIGGPETEAPVSGDGSTLDGGGDGGSPSEAALLREIAAAPAARPAALDEGGGPLRGSARFTVRRCLGRGGFGTVYEAHDRDRGAPVAIKVLHRCDPRALYLFKQEFRALGDLAHPGLVQLYELFADGADWYFTMELVRGGTLLDHLRRHGAEAPAPGDSEEAAPLGLGRLCDALLRLCDALEALHGSGKVHRDIKPQNVLCTPEGRVVLLDFGLLRDAAPGGESLSEISGTPEYMAPEQAAARPPGPASDWYGVGVLLYEALTGTRPFTGPLLEVLARKQTEDGPAPSAVLQPGGVPAELDRLCQELLRRDPAARPDGAAVRARLLALRGRLDPPAPPRQERPSPSPLLGRQDALAALDSAHARSGAGAVVVLCHGSSGAGKSTLLRHFLQRAQERDPEAAVLSGRCFEHEQIPYKALDGVVDGLSRLLRRLPRHEAAALLPRDVAALCRLFPVLLQVPAAREAPERRIADPQGQQRAAFQALRELLARLSDRRRVVLHIDDLQWGDLDSVALLGEVLRPPDAPALLLCASYRAEEAESSPVLRGLRALCAGLGAAVCELPLVELGPESAEALARSLLPAGAAALAGRIARESGGNPFYINELARHAQEGDAAPTVEEALARRVARLPGPARRLLELVCVAGQPIARAQVRAALEDGAAPPAAADGPGAADAAEPQALALLRAGHLVRVRWTGADEELIPYHDRVREAVVARLGADALRARHLRLAAVLAAAGAEPERLLVHHRAAGEVARAARCAVAAAARAYDALAFARAARLYEEALGAGALDEAERRALWPRLADAHAAAGRLRDAARAYLQAAEGAEPGAALALQRRAMEQLLLGRDLQGGLAVAAELLPRVGLRVPPGGRRALLGLLWLRLWLALRGLRCRLRPAAEVPAAELLRLDALAPLASTLGLLDPLRGALAETSLLLRSLRAGEPERLGRVLGLEAYLRALRGRQGEAAAILERARGLLGPGAPPDAGGLLDLAAASMLQEGGRWREGTARAREVAVFFDERCVGLAWAADLARTCVVLGLWWLGEVRELAALLPPLVRDAQDRGTLLLLRMALHVQGHVHLCHDDVAAAEEVARRLAAQPAGEGGLRDRLAEIGSAVMLDLYRGDAAAAWSRVAAAWPDLRRAGLLGGGSQRVLARSLRGGAALAARDAGGPWSLLRVAAREARRLCREPSPWAQALGLLLRAGVARRRGDRQALERLRQAEGALRAAELGLYAASARLRRGVWLGGPEGAALRGEAERQLLTEGVRRPDRVAAMLVP